LSEVNPKSSWISKLSNLVDEHEIDVSQMGFPVNWENKLIEIKNVAIKHLS
jgi:hypothetical protein